MFISIQEANAAIGSMDSAYHGIVIKGFYMPKRRSSIITTEYLFKVMTNQVFKIKQSYIKIGQPFQKATSLKLLEQLRILQVEKSWGFDEDHLPDKVWMVNALFTLNPSNPIFRSYSTECISTLNPEDIRQRQFQFFLYICGSLGRFFNRTQEQSNAFKTHISQQHKQKKKQKIQEKVKKIEELKHRFQCFRRIKFKKDNSNEHIII